jgi:hypothetical protein
VKAKKPIVRKRKPAAKLGSSAIPTDGVSNSADLASSEKFKIRLPTTPSATLNCTIAELDKAIRQLIKQRALITKGKTEPAPVGPVRGARSPTVLVNMDAMANDTIFHVQYPGLGWLSFTLTEEQVAGLLPVLIGHQSKRKDLKARARSN